MSQTPPPPPTGGDPQQVPYGTPQFPGYGPIAPDHPQATTVLILGIVGVVVCGIASPFAWVIGNRVVKEIDASGGRLGGRSNANAGRILGIVWSVLMIIGLVLGILGLLVFILTAAA